MRLTQTDEDLRNLDQDMKEALLKIAREANKAMLKHPKWPSSDVIHAAAIVSEESGELIRAAIQFHYENGKQSELFKEAIQTGAMAVRFLISR